MTPAATAKPDAPPDDPLRAALDDQQVRRELLEHARAGLGNRPRAEWEQLAEDAVQEALTRALQSRDSFGDRPGTVTAWLHGILNNVLKEMMRRHGRYALAPADPAVWEALEASLEDPDRVTARLDIPVLLSRLPQDQQALLRLRIWEDLSHEEIAGRLGISVVNARVRCWRALTALKALAGERPGEDGP